MLLLIGIQSPRLQSLPFIVIMPTIAGSRRPEKAVPSAAKEPGNRRENLESRRLVRFAVELARSLEIKKLLVQADELPDIRTIERMTSGEVIIWLIRDGSEFKGSGEEGEILLHIPEVPLSRMSQIHLGLFLAVINNLVSLDESIICLSGVAGSKRLDTLQLTNPRRDFPWFEHENFEESQPLIRTKEFARIVDIALRFAAEGREGRPFGTTFVLGNPDELRPYLRQIVLNPCIGHPHRSRDIHNPDFLESLREFALMDGAFVVNAKGIVESAGTYLDAAAHRISLKPGLGARHTSAAAITAQTDSVAVVVSESSGTVTVFNDGSIVFELEKSGQHNMRDVHLVPG